MKCDLSMNINDSKKIINKKLLESYLKFICNVLDKEKLFILLSAYISLFSNYDSVGGYLRNFCTLSSVYLLFGTLFALVERKEEVTEINFYRQLKYELNNNINRFENVTENDVEEEIKKIKNLRY